MSDSSVPSSLTRRLLSTATAASVGLGAGLGVSSVGHVPAPSPEVLLAMEIGAHYEGLRFTPYRDGGGVWTVCRGITGPAVDQAARTGKRYSEAECKRLELAHYAQAERDARRLYRHWGSYNMWVRASMLDMLYNLGAAQVGASTHVREANAGRLDAACAQMLRWVWGRDARTGQKVRWAGLVKRRNATAEICAEWGRDGHFSAGV
ncbi:glycoside hydrolase family protein [Vandammella animalimorsus]|uniref:lysozyme n=1 Tax=Vandammella animalimorsus TaxID=2029117 RepID=UPI00270F2CCD|nr:glycoside hydrolase family protein [Comamonadaceae bacterium]